MNCASFSSAASLPLALPALLFLCLLSCGPVDRTPPELIETPVEGKRTYVDELSFYFSEFLMKSSIRQENISARLSDGTNLNPELHYTDNFIFDDYAEDPPKIVVRFDGDVPPNEPIDISFSTEGVQDLSGNTIEPQVIERTVEYKSVAETLNVSTNAASIGQLSSDINSKGNKVFAFSVNSLPTNPDTKALLMVYRQRSNNWELIGEFDNSPYDYLTELSNTNFDIKINEADTPFLAYISKNETGLKESLSVRTWNGTEWVMLGSPISKETESGQIIHLQMHLSGETLQPTVLWVQGRPENHSIYVRRWTGDTWEPITEVTNVVNEPGSQLFSQSIRPLLTTDESGGLYLIWCQDSSMFMNVETPQEPTLAVSSLNSDELTGCFPVVSNELVSKENKIVAALVENVAYVRTLEKTSDWVASEAIDDAYSVTFSFNSNNSFSLKSVDSNGNIYVEWVEFYDGPETYKTTIFWDSTFERWREFSGNSGLLQFDGQETVYNFDKYETGNMYTGYTYGVRASSWQ